MKQGSSFRTITLLIFGMGLLLCSLSFVLADYQFQRDLESRTKEMEDRNLNLALAMEQNLNRSFAQADVILRLMKAQIEQDGLLDTAQVGLFKDFLKPGIFNQIAMADTRGNLVFSAVPMNESINISDRAHFRTHIDADSGKMFISAPYVTRANGTPSIFLSRRLNDAGGNFAGIVSVGIAPAYFSNVFGQLQLGTNNSFVLLKTDGTFLARIPSIDSAEIMSAYKAHPVLAMINQGASFGILEWQGVADGVARVGAFRKLSDYQAVVLMGISKNVAFAEVVARHSDYRKWAGIFSAILIATLLLLWRQVRKQFQAKNALRQANEYLERKVEERTQELQASNEELTAQNEEMTALHEEMIAQNEEIKSMNEEITALNQDLAGMNEELEQRVDERTADLTDAYQEVTAQHQELEQSQEALRRNAQIQIVLREIAEAAVLAPSLDELYRTVHRLIDRVLPAKLFHINLLDEAAGEIVVPFNVDDVTFIPARRPIDKGMTEYIMRLGNAVHITPAEMDRLCETGEYTLAKVQRVPIRHYLGAPLINSKGKGFGVLGLITMGETPIFQPEDVEVLSIIAAQVSQAIERKRAEESLAKSESLQKSILRAAPVGIGLVRQRILQSANKRLCAMTGYSETELVGQSARIFYPSQEEYEFVGEEKYRQISIFGTGTVETKWQCKAGAIIDVLLSSTPLDGRDLDRGVTFTALDITNRKQAEEELVESEARYRAVIAQAPEAILLCDPYTYEVLEANSHFAERFGYDLRQDGPLNLFDIIEDSRLNIEVILATLRQDGFLPAGRRIFRHKNGMRITAERSSVLVRYRGRALNLVTLRDVTEEVRQEQEIRRDAELATRLQNALLSAPESSDYLEIATIYQPSGYVGGDLYFMAWRYEGVLLRGFLVDAAGHGLGTALHTASLHVLLREVNERDLPLADAMRWLNKRASEYFDDTTFAGALGFELDLQTRQLRWVCAGIPKVWLATKTQQGAVKSPGMCLGIHEDETFETHTVSVEVGDSLYFMTDGLADLLEGWATLPLNRYPEMVGLLRTLSEGEERRDDATAVCIHVQSFPGSLVRQDGWPRILRFNGYGDYQRLKGEVAKILVEVTGKPHSLQEVAVHEALANAMECRDGVPRQHKARLRCNKVGNRLIVRVKTSRMGFAGNAILRRLRSQPDDMFSFGEDASMGRGIPMMLSMSHRMTYNSEGTEVLLAWKL